MHGMHVLLHYATGCPTRSNLGRAPIKKAKTMNLPTSNHLTLQGDARTILIALADEFQNNYLTVARFAEVQGLSVHHASILLQLAQDVRASKHQEA